MNNNNIWRVFKVKKILKYDHCSYRYNYKTLKLCKLKENIFKTCDKLSCPIINDNYVSLNEEKGKIYILTKIFPRKNNKFFKWRKICLHNNFMIALMQIESLLIYWPKRFMHFIKLRISIFYQKLAVLNNQLKYHSLITQEICKKNEIFKKYSNYISHKFNYVKMIKKEIYIRLLTGKYGRLSRIFTNNNMKINKKLGFLDMKNNFQKIIK
uniref:Cell cycle and ribosome biogenesis protein n=1 Tax=Amorphochlora amoebiformis TaxID=1561963 RepID=A0A0H5BLX1_9EUKA|nr:cell cycle and ribosome biogenesis protein [Amorphochlora amoebiformis]